MGSISSKTHSTTNSDVPNSCEDCSSFFHSLKLPPYPPEVDVHIQKWKSCRLLHKTLTLEETACSGNLSLPRQREYLVHEPVGLRRVRDDQKNLALVICLHGTDETITDNELLVQEDNQTIWLELSDKDTFLLVFPQSLTYQATNDSPMSWRPLGDELRSAWLPDHNDEDFISCLLEELHHDYPIDKSRIYCIGYSNGGLFLTSLLLSHSFNTRFTAVCNYMGGVCPDQMKNEAGLDSESILYHLDQPCISLVGIGNDYDFNSATGNKLDEDNPCIPVHLENVFTHPLSWKSYWISTIHCIDASTKENKDNTVTTPIMESSLVSLVIPNSSAKAFVCNVAESPLQMESKQSFYLVESSSPPPIYIVTGTSDTNRSYCYTSLCVFQELGGYKVFFDDLKNVKHEYQSLSTYDVWRFFKLLKRKL